MADENEKKREESREPEKEKGGKARSNTPIIAGIIAGVIVIEAIMLFVFMRMTRPPSTEEVEEKMKEDSLKYTSTQQTTVGAIMETPIEAVVNIAGTDGMRFLKVVLVLEYDDREYKRLGLELERRQPKLKNLLIEQLSAMTLDEVNDPEAQTQIRKEYVRLVNSSLPEKIGQISNVYLNEYIVQ
jgi:flagellar basal body-associated protein FliL